jgi:hypothetical protein
MRTWPFSLTLTAIIALPVLTACAEPGGDTKVVRGTASTGELNQELTSLGVTLPPDTSQLEWLMVRTWDTNDTYLRLTASRSSVVGLLGEANLEESSLQPVSSAEDYDWVLPEEVLSSVKTSVPVNDIDWSLSEIERKTAIAHVQEGSLPSAGAVVIDPQADQPVLILHMYR